MAQTTYTYNDFENAAKNAGLLNKFSTADLELAKNNPTAGMDILNAKIDYRNAATDEEKKAANDRANIARAQYGSYTGGVDGSEYNAFGAYSGSGTPSAGGLYTYDDVMAAAIQAGVWDSMSDADRRLLQSNPDAGLTLIHYKRDWNNATTDEQRAAANAGAEGVRQMYGNYSGGSDGSGYYLGDKTPGSVVTGYERDLNDLWENMKNYGEFSYDKDADPVYQAYRKEYLREGDRATQNALGQAAAMTGGIPSSYAVNAASQAGNYYAAQLSDKIPELYADAYNRWLDQYNILNQNLSTAAALDQTKYDREVDDINYRLNKNQLDLENSRYDTEWAYQKEQNAIANALNLWNMYGYATQTVADVLGVEVGTPTSSQAYQDWQREYAASRSASSGSSGGGGRSSGSSGSSSNGDYGSGHTDFYYDALNNIENGGWTRYGAMWRLEEWLHENKITGEEYSELTTHPILLDYNLDVEKTSK